MHDDRRTTPPIRPTTGPVTPVEATFVPDRYEPNYPYPLLVLLHRRGGNEQQLIESMPTMSWRNYVGLSFRGPEALRRDSETTGYRWGQEFGRPGQRSVHSESTQPLPNSGVVLQQMMEGSLTESVDSIEETVFAGIHRTMRSLHVHSERIFLVGEGEGAAVAFRLGLSHPDRFAGVVSLNGWIPEGFRPFARWHDCRKLRVLMLHGLWATKAPVAEANATATLLKNAGLSVTLRTYPASNRTTRRMLSDADSWLIEECVAGQR